MRGTSMGAPPCVMPACPRVWSVWGCCWNTAPRPTLPWPHVPPPHSTRPAWEVTWPCLYLRPAFSWPRNIHQSNLFTCLGSADCVKLLIAVDACLEYDLYYGTPLHVACANDYVDCVKALLNAGECDHGAELTKALPGCDEVDFFLKPQAQK